MIYINIRDLKKNLASNALYSGRPIYMTSGGFDPLHIGHVRCILETGTLANSPSRHPMGMRGIVVVVVNGDGFLYRKKGYAFMNENERMEIIDSLKGVDFVTSWDDEGQTVTGAIKLLKPSYFTKGGDRDSSANVPEFDMCEKIGCKVLFNIGGNKIQSSSELVDNLNKKDGA